MPHDVLLVGAGPGPADLLTLRAVRAIETAEVLLYDALVSEEVLALAPANCLRLLTGKRSGRPSMRQETINALMLRFALRGKRVVRLKGGDPSVFGRSGEETAFLAAHGVGTAVIPGVTAASAAAAQFGFPLTHRGEARRLVFATARVRDGAVVEEGWSRGIDAETTLALYMARDAFPAVAAHLLATGLAPATPAIAVENAGRPEARALHGTLATLPERLEAARADGPVVIIVGHVAAAARGQALDDALAA